LETETVLEANVSLFQCMTIGARDFGVADRDILKVAQAVQ